MKSAEHGATTMCSWANGRGAVQDDSCEGLEVWRALYGSDVEWCDHPNLDDAVTLYTRAGLLCTRSLANYAATREAAVRNWRTMHGRDSNLAFTLVPRGGGRDAMISAVRAWDRTRLTTHFFALPSAARGASNLLQLACLDAIRADVDCEYASFFVKALNRPMNAALERFAKLIGTPPSVLRTGLQRWVYPQRGELRGSPPCAAVRRLDTGDERLLAGAAERAFGGRTADALSFVPGGVRLPHMAAAFGRAGLERSRAVYAIRQSGAIVGFLANDVSPPGANLTGILDATWCIPMDPSVDRGTLSALVPTGLLGEAPPHRWLLCPAEGSWEGLGAAGFVRDDDVYLYTLDRSMMQAYRDYLAARRRALHAMRAE